MLREAAGPGSALHCGDNLHVLRHAIPEASVDLVYLDPPFQSGRSYGVSAALRNRKTGARPVHAFEDTWRWGPEAEAAYQDVLQAGGPAAGAVRALRGLTGDTDLMAYLCMMAPRLAALHRALKPTGSLYLHCDPSASHYLKVLLDAIFGPACFRNEVVWRYRRWPATARHFQRMHDVLLVYARSPSGEHKFRTLYGYEKLADSTLKTFGTRKQRADFSGGHRKPGTEDTETQGPPLSDVWEIGVIAAIGRERLGYPTQKPEALLERVLLASSDEGDVILDPFCGSGTTLAVAQRLGRRWIGIDVSHLALGLVKHRLAAAFGPELAYTLHGEPRTLDEACALAARDPRQLTYWLLGRVGARPVDRDLTPDPAVDGRLLSSTPASRASASSLASSLASSSASSSALSRRAAPHQTLLAIEPGAPTPDRVRALAAAVDREQAERGVLLTLHAPGRDVLAHVEAAGSFPGLTGPEPRLRVLTVAEILAGARIDMPSRPPLARTRPAPARAARRAV